MSEDSPALQPPLPPTTTHQEDVTTAGQRKVNLIWEYTQAIIAVSVVFANLACAVFSVISVRATMKIEIPGMLTNALFLVVGFYFSRTNHAAIGGVGSKPSSKYEGR